MVMDGNDYKENEITLCQDQWREFVEVLEKPTEPCPALHRLLTEPSVVELAQRGVEEV
jgi:uncharacterized protein (DUF1778 family)